METELREAICSGLFVEFCDERGNCVAQSVYLDWNQPVPAVGDTLSCGVTHCTTGRNTTFSGRVRSRQFDVQRDADGSVSVRVRLEVDLAARANASRKTSLPRYTPMMFSDN